MRSRWLFEGFSVERQRRCYKIRLKKLLTKLFTRTLQRISTPQTSLQSNGVVGNADNGRPPSILFLRFPLAWAILPIILPRQYYTCQPRMLQQLLSRLPSFRLPTKHIACYKIQEGMFFLPSKRANRVLQCEPTRNKIRIQKLSCRQHSCISEVVNRC